MENESIETNLLNRINNEAFIQKCGFCLGVTKHMAMHSSPSDLSLFRTVFAGVVNSIVISVASELIPENLRFTVVFLDLGIFCYNKYSRKKKYREEKSNRSSTLPSYIDHEDDELSTDSLTSA